MNADKSVFKHFLCCFGVCPVLSLSTFHAVFKHYMCCLSALYVLYLSTLCYVFPGALVHGAAGDVASTVVGA